MIPLVPGNGDPIKFLKRSLPAFMKGAAILFIRVAQKAVKRQLLDIIVDSDRVGMKRANITN